MSFRSPKTGVTLPGVSSTSRPPGIAISPSVIDQDVFLDRLTIARRDVESAAVAVQPTATDQQGVEIRAERLHRLYVDIGSPVQLGRAPGVRGHLAFQVKRVVHKLIGWYVHASGAAQKEFDAELARLASDTSTTIATLERRVAHLEDWNDQLLRRLRRLERDGDSGRAT